MKLSTLIKSLDNYHIYSQLDDFEVEGISCNSKKVSPNFVFVAIKGTQTDGNVFIEEAIKRGARAVIIQSPLGRRSTQEKKFLIKVKDTRKALGVLAAEFYGNPSERIKVVGITGTNGKTTVTYLLEALLEEAGSSPGVIGTINYRFKDKVYPSVNTTPGPIELQSMLADMLKENLHYAIMEVSSHALAQHRTEAIHFHSAIFTNLTQDHLDYHHTLEEYFQAKAGLFKDIDSGAFAVINNDDAYGRKIKELSRCAIVTYGIDTPSDIMAKEIWFDMLQTRFVLKTGDSEINLKTRLIGRHNVYNMLATIAWALREGLGLDIISSVVSRFHAVPGRLERIDFNGDFGIFVDYAHTEDALRNVINTLRPLTKDKLIVVFGCGGERDKTKRPKMGAVVTELADFAIITSDNPRSEDPLEIIEDIKKGIRKENFSAVPERGEAIRKAISLARKGDIVLVAGKGHENCQILKDKIIHFDDREAIRECLKSMNY